MQFTGQCHLTAYAYICQDQLYTVLCHFFGRLTTLFIHTFTTLSHENYRIQNYTPPVTDVVNMYNTVYVPHVQHMQHVQKYNLVHRCCISIITLCMCKYGQGWMMRMCGSI